MFVQYRHITKTYIYIYHILIISLFLIIIITPYAPSPAYDLLFSCLLPIAYIHLFVNFCKNRLLELGWHYGLNEHVLQGNRICDRDAVCSANAYNNSFRRFQRYLRNANGLHADKMCNVHKI